MFRLVLLRSRFCKLRRHIKIYNLLLNSSFHFVLQNFQDDFMQIYFYLTFQVGVVGDILRPPLTPSPLFLLMYKMQRFF